MEVNTSPLFRFIVDGNVPLLLGRGVAIRWEIREEWKYKPLKVFVLFGRSPTDEFEIIAEVEDDVEYVDQDRRINAYTDDAWYALKIQSVETGEAWYSNPQPVGSALRKREWLIAKEIVRRELVRFIRLRAATRGWLLRRRITGEQCTYCSHPDTGQSTRAHCKYCYGTTFLGGYYKPQEMWLELLPDVQLRRLDPEQGAMAASQQVGRCLAYPKPHPEDYWISSKTGLAYRFKEQIVASAIIDEEPLIFQVDLEIQHKDHVIYTYPLPAET